jgi:hypothetical protein
VGPVQIGLAKEQALPIVTPFPQLLACRPEALEGGVDEQMGETIHLRAVTSMLEAVGMLEVGMPFLGGGLVGQGRDIHAIVVDQAQS